jgi:hypothetical protein
VKNIKLNKKISLSMSTDTEIINQGEKPTSELESDEILEIDITNITGKQKKALLSVPVTLFLQIVFFFNLQSITNIFKGMIVNNGYAINLVADYVTQFVNTLVPYLLIIFLVLALYFSYIIIINNEEYFKILEQTFNYIVLGIVTDLVFLFISLGSLDPTTIELFIFLFVVLLSIAISLVPFAIYGLLNKETKTEKTTTSDS